ncbi:MAG: hypothetical protein WC637_00100 [Victivallales bacterium]|jgi:hypothetical protein
MTKRELDFLEKCFARQLEGYLFQSKSKLADKLEAEGFICKESKYFGRDRFGAIVCHGYALTYKGNFAYCNSERCHEPLP